MRSTLARKMADAMLRLSEFDFSARVQLASSSDCAGAQTPSIALKLHLDAPDGSQQQVRGNCSGVRGLGLM